VIHMTDGQICLELVFLGSASSGILLKLELGQQAAVFSPDYNKNKKNRNGHDCSKIPTNCSL
jgi:hypothetical protein